MESLSIGNSTDISNLNPENIQEYINDFTKIIDTRIKEVTNHLQESKKELIEVFTEEITTYNTLSVNLKDLHNSIFCESDISGLDSISKLKKLKESLDNYLNKVDHYFDIRDKYAHAKLSDLVKIKKDQFYFTKYKLNSGNKKDFIIPEWNKTQFKQNFTLPDPNTIDIKYVSCYELFVSETVFSSGKNIYRMEVDCITTTSYHSLGLVNESYIFGTSCVCLKSQNAFMVDRSGNTFMNSVISNTGIAFNDGGKYIFEFEINLENEEDKFMLIIFKENNYGPYKIIGKEFKVAVGMCNGGNVIYKFLE